MQKQLPAHPALAMAAMSCASNPHCSKVLMGFGGAKPATVISIWLRKAATCSGRKPGTSLEGYPKGTQPGVYPQHASSRCNSIDAHHAHGA